MSILEVKKYPDPLLKREAFPVKEINGALQNLINDMLETMHDAPGIGLAAPQVGESQRLIVVDVSPLEETNSIIVLINPEVVEAEGKIVSEEGCLSVPGYVSTIERSEKVYVKGIDREGKLVEYEAAGLLARALQHEIDHLDGILFLDRLSPIKREFFIRRYLRNQKELA